MTTKQPATPFDAELAHMHGRNINERRGRAFVEASRNGYLRALADMHHGTPCEWQTAMLGISFLGADGELSKNPQAAAAQLEQTCRTEHQILVDAKKQLFAATDRLDALASVLTAAWEYLEASTDPTENGGMYANACKSQLRAALADHDKRTGGAS